MSRPKGGTNKYWTKEEKLKIVQEVMKSGLMETCRKKNIYFGMVTNWVKKYKEEGENGLINKKKPGNPLCKYSSKKELTREENLEFENMKLRIELERLKKGYIVKGVGQNKEYISINNKSTK